MEGEELANRPRCHFLAGTNITHRVPPTELIVRSAHKSMQVKVLNWHRYQDLAKYFSSFSFLSGGLQNKQKQINKKQQQRTLKKIQPPTSALQASVLFFLDEEDENKVGDTEQASTP